MQALTWLPNALLCGFLLLSAGSYLFSASTIEGVRDLGFPDSFRLQLAALKLLAFAAMALPGVPVRAVEWAHVGVALFLVTALVAHVSHGDGIALSVVLLLLLTLVVLANLHRHGPTARP